MLSLDADAITLQRARIGHALCAALDRENASTRCYALRALQKLDASDEKTGKKIVTLLLDPDPDVRADTAVALGNLKFTDAIAPLLKNIEGDPEGEVRIQATIALGEIGSASILPSLTRCIKREGYPELDFPPDDTGFSTCWEVQRQALEALEKIDCPQASADLREILQDENFDYLRADGYRVLMNLDPQGSARFLLDQYERGDTATKIDAMRALRLSRGINRSEQADLREIIVAALTHTDARLRREAVKTAARLFATDKAVISALPVLLQDPDDEVRQTVLAKLPQFASDELLEILHELTAQTPSHHLPSLLRLLGSMGNDSSAEIISRFLGHKDEAVRYAAVEALTNIAVPVATGELLQIAAGAGQDDLIRLQAIRVLTSTFHLLDEPAASTAAEGEAEEEPLTGRVIEVFERAVHDDSERVGFTALSALTELNPDQAEAILLRYLNGNAEDPEQKGDIPITIVTEPVDTSEPEDTSSPGETVLLEDVLPYLPDGGSAESSTLGSIFHRAEQSEPPQTTGETATDTASEAIEERVEEPQAGPVPDGVALLATRLLGGLPFCSEEAIARLLKAATQECLRSEVIRTIGRLGDHRGLPLILEVLESGTPQQRILALDAMRSISRLEDMTETLKRLAGDEDPMIREKALLPFATIEGDEAARIITQGLRDAETPVCKAALAALNPGNSTPDTAELLLDLMFRHGGELRMDIAAALARLGDYSLAERLMEILDDESLDEQHWICVEVLAEMFSHKNRAA